MSYSVLIRCIIPVWFLICAPASASADTKTLLIKVWVGERAKLTVEKNTVTFPNRDPNKRELIPALENDAQVIVKVRTEKRHLVNLLVIANADLTSGSDTIPVQNAIWQASGPGFVNGTLGKTTPQMAGPWIGGGVRERYFPYYLRDSWNYQVGNYQATVTYTLVSP
jgi:hypothetical protein